jgi:hypothetical protein
MTQGGCACMPMPLAAVGGKRRASRFGGSARAKRSESTAELFPPRGELAAVPRWRTMAATRSADPRDEPGAGSGSPPGIAP